MQQVDCRNEGFEYYEYDDSCWSDLPVFTSWFNEITVTSCIITVNYSCFLLFFFNTNNVSLYLARIFFALASPVFHAQLYGTLKERGDVEISDVSIDAFHCLQKYGATILFDHSSFPPQIACCFPGTSIRIALMLFPWQMSWMFWRLRKSIWWRSLFASATGSFRPIWRQITPFRCGCRYRPQTDAVFYYCWRFISIDLC